MANRQVIDVDKMMAQCSFTSASYVASATAIVSGIQVEATKPATTGASESATGGAGKMAVSILGAAGAGQIKLAKPLDTFAYMQV